MMVLKRKVIVFVTKIALRIFGRAANQEKEREFLLLPPHGFGSLGDEAMMIAILEHFFASGKVVDIVSFSAEGCWADRLVNVSGFGVEYSLNGRFGSPFNIWPLLKLVGNYKNLLVVGADIMDGTYSELQSCKRLDLMGEAARRGTKSVLVGSSFKKSVSPNILRRLAKLSLNPAIAINARDEMSYQRLDKEGVKVRRVMDVAFLLSPSQGDSELLSTLVPRSYFVVNINSIHYKLYGNQLLNLLQEEIVNICKEHRLSVVLVPHDVREDAFDAPSDLSILRLLHNNLVKELGSAVSLIDDSSLIDAASVKRIAAGAVFVITGRMHLAIASLGSAVPVISFTYQDKFEGLYCFFFGDDRRYLLDRLPCKGELSLMAKGIIVEGLNLRIKLETAAAKARSEAVINFSSLGL